MPPDERRRAGAVARVAGVVAIVGAVVLAAALLFWDSGGGYTVHARFTNAGQLVKGNPVQTGGVPIGSVKSIDITDEGQAEIEFAVDDDHSPLPVGTHVTIRQFSQSGIANRYIALTPGLNSSPELDDGAVLGTEKTTTPVDLELPDAGA